LQDIGVKADINLMNVTSFLEDYSNSDAVDRKLIEANFPREMFVGSSYNEARRGWYFFIGLHWMREQEYLASRNEVENAIVQLRETRKN